MSKSIYLSGLGLCLFKELYDVFYGSGAALSSLRCNNADDVIVMSSVLCKLGDKTELESQTGDVKFESGYLPGRGAFSNLAPAASSSCLSLRSPPTL